MLKLLLSKKMKWWSDKFPLALLFPFAYCLPHCCSQRILYSYPQFCISPTKVTEIFRAKVRRCFQSLFYWGSPQCLESIEHSLVLNSLFLHAVLAVGLSVCLLYGPIPLPFTLCPSLKWQCSGFHPQPALSSLRTPVVLNCGCAAESPEQPWKTQQPTSYANHLSRITEGWGPGTCIFSETPQMMWSQPWELAWVSYSYPCCR